MDAVPLRWVERSKPLAAVAVAASGACARALAKRILAGPFPSTLQGVAGVDVLVFQGELAALPWVDGVVYLGQPTGTSLLLPTTHGPDIPEALLVKALARLGVEGPAAILLHPTRIIPMTSSRAVDAGMLGMWLERAP